MNAYGRSSPGFDRSATNPRSCTRRNSAAQYRSRKASYRLKARVVAARHILRSTYSCSWAAISAHSLVQRFCNAANSRFSAFKLRPASPLPSEIIPPVMANPPGMSSQPRQPSQLNQVVGDSGGFAPAFPHTPFHPRSFKDPSPDFRNGSISLHSNR